MPRMVISGYKVREARLRRSWTAQEFARHMGVSLQTVYRWEWGTSKPPRDKAQAIALTLGVALSSLAGDA